MYNFIYSNATHTKISWIHGEIFFSLFRVKEKSSDMCMLQIRIRSPSLFQDGYAFRVDVLLHGNVSHFIFLFDIFAIPRMRPGIYGENKRNKNGSAKLTRRHFSVNRTIWRGAPLTYASCDRRQSAVTREFRKRSFFVFKYTDQRAIAAGWNKKARQSMLRTFSITRCLCSGKTSYFSRFFLVHLAGWR